ncbi:MAG TPA: hypothetical protein VGM16_10665 [Gammaproteobacteria bacterium]
MDGNTGKPLAGVVVMAFWELHNGSFTGHSFGCGAIDVEEAVTDGDGQFHIPGWGPISSSCDMRGVNPTLILFKPGYDWRGVNNDPLDPIATVTVSSSVWDGKTINLYVPSDMDLTRIDAQGYAFHFESLNDLVGRFALSGCNWKKIPNMLRAIYLQEQGFRAAGQVFPTVTSRLIMDDAAWQKTAPECGSPKAFIEGLVK